ncbi:MAG TPA: hypothetical protein VN932_10665 [Rhizomicrobium sp.]|nr:hypothetical protein [Rhizomicrobium sp.]
MRSDSDRFPSTAAIALGAFVFGALALLAGQFTLRRIMRRRSRPRKMDDLIVNHRYERLPGRRAAANDDPWEHYEDVLG